MANEQNTVKLDVRAYPIAEPKGSTVAFASVTINDMIGIAGIRVVNGKNGLFASMPQEKDNKGVYRESAFPVTKELRQQLNEAILKEYAVQKNAPEKASVKDQIKDAAQPAKETPAAPAAEKGKNAKKAAPEH